jgi:hypothetical protein
MDQVVEAGHAGRHHLFYGTISQYTIISIHLIEQSFIEQGVRVSQSVTSWGKP